MEHGNIFELLTPIHTDWLYRRREKKLDVTSADLDSIESAFPAAAQDPLFADYRDRANRGTLHRRPGRKPLSIPEYLRLWAIRFAIEDEMAAIWAKRRSGEGSRVRGDREPYYQAAETVIARFGLHCTPRALVNRLSKLGMS